MREKVPKALTNIRSSKYSKLIAENQQDQYKNCLIFEGLQDGRKQMSVAVTVTNFAI